MANDYLVHHGILGMKWGRRRYQNKDGTLTAAGRKRLEKRERKVQLYNEKNKYTNSQKTSPVANRAKSMSDEELRSAIERLKLERDYIDLMTPKNKETTKKGNSWIREMFRDSAKKVGGDATKYVMSKTVNTMFGDNVSGVNKKDMMFPKFNTSGGNDPIAKALQATLEFEEKK